MKGSRFYRMVKWLASRSLRVYFNEIAWEGLENIPRDKPYIIAPNHQNALLDPILIAAFHPKPVHFLTRSDIFNKRTTPWLSRVNMLPVYRMKDGFDKLGNNGEVFEACTEILKSNQPVLIFPEGNHGEHYFLRPLTKGTARLAFHAQANLDEELLILPVGLNFFSHRLPRTKVIIVFGKPITVGDYLKEYERDQQAGLKNLTTALSEGIKECLVIPEHSEDYAVKARKVFDLRNEGLSFRKLRELAARTYPPDKVQFVEPSPTGFQKFLLGLSFVPNWGPLLVLKHVLDKFEDKVFWGTMKYVTLLLAMPVWWLLGFSLGWLLFGFWEGLVLVFLSVVGLFVRMEVKRSV